MKRLLIVAMAFFTIMTNAQENRENTKRTKGHDRPEMRPEQIATLKSKQMALKLDLNENQVERIKKLELENATKRQAKRQESRADRSSRKDKPTSDEIFERKNERLTKALAHKQEMKSILSEEQYVKWEKGHQRRAMKIKQFKRKKMLKKKRMVHNKKKL